MIHPVGKVKLTEGGLGDALPAEMWEEVADFHRAAVSHVQKDHAENFAGIPVHTSKRWARAAAIIRIPKLLQGMAQPPTPNILAAYGFRRTPSLSIREAPGGDGGPGLGAMLEWELLSRAPQHILYGWRVWNYFGVSDTPMAAADLGGGRGELWLGSWYPRDEDHDARPSPALENVDIVSLLIR